MYVLLNDMIANDLEWGWRSLCCFNCSVFTHTLESAPCLWFKLYCQRSM